MAFVYSCCFWCSLRLGGILIGLFSLLQAVLLLVLQCMARVRIKDVIDEIDRIIATVNLIFTKDYVENFRDDPQKIIALGITMNVIYIILCLMYIYGAYVCYNILMYGYILAELIRLLLLTGAVVIWLLLLKQNIMDIGLLIGASVASGFFLLGMFYLWVCTTNLPILINEMKHDEQAATILKLQQMLDANQRRNVTNMDEVPFAVDSAETYRKPIFTTRNNRNSYNNNNKPFVAGSRIPAPYFFH